MIYIKNEDYDYIMNKYHDTKKPFDPFSRFIRNDSIFSADTGLDGEEIKSGILRLDATISHLPHTIRKARALEFVLKNTRISCDRRDPFPAINAVDRPLSSTIVKNWEREVFKKTIPEVHARCTQLERDGIVRIYPDYDHSVPDWDRVLSLGFCGLLHQSETARKSRKLTEDEETFFEGVRLTYLAIIDFIGRLRELAEKTAGSEKLALALRNIQYGAPKTFYEALLIDYLYFILSEHIDSLQVRSICNFDRLLYRFYLDDLKRGVSEEEIRTDLAYFFLQFTAIGNYWNQPVYLGGENKDGSTVINELSYLFLDVYDKMGIYNPKIQIKISDSTPKDFVLRALDMIRRGHNCIVFVSDNTMRKALMRTGVSEDDARTCDVKGCYEYSPRGSFECGMNYMNLMKPLEYALHRGCDGVTGTFSGMASPAPESYTSFDMLYGEYKRHLKRIVDLTVETVNSFENYFSDINPQSLLSATYSSCIEKGRDAMHGGATTNGSLILFGFIAEIADSLTMIKKYVYEKKLLTLGELIAMLDSNFKGNEAWRARLRADREKYGNNKDTPDAIATDIVNFLASSVVGVPNASERGGSWNLGFHVARMSYMQAGLTASSANGRLVGEELSKNVSASMGQNREGATAAILSATKLDATSFTSDAALDLGLLPSAVMGDDGLMAMYGLLMTFCNRGGHALHINVFDADTLRDAQKNPEKYQDLQIRVCGWNVLWNNINKEEQDGFIRQAEALV